MVNKVCIFDLDGTLSLCEFHIIDRCFVTKEEVSGHLKTRSQNCPLIEVEVK